MGLVYNEVGNWIKAYDEKATLIREAIVTPGQEEVNPTLESITRGEVEKLAKKLDILANYKQNEAIARMVAKSFPSIVAAVQWVKNESHEQFRGMKSMGKQLDICWLRPEDVGGAILNKAETASKGLYAGTSKEVYSWITPAVYVAGTAKDYIPEQTMKDEAACIHLGMINTVAVPKENRIGFKVSGQRAPDQSLSFSHTDGSELSLQEFEYPVIVGPKQKQQVQVDPYIAGDSKPELLTLLVAMAEDLQFTFA
jgi:hypothetical protein